MCVYGAAWYVWERVGYRRVCVCVEKASVRENVCVYNVSERVRVRNGYM